MDYKEKVIALLNDQELSKEQKEKLENIFPELKESKDERIRKTLIEYIKGIKSWNFEPKTLDADKVIAWLVANICDFEYYVKLFKKDFGL